MTAQIPDHITTPWYSGSLHSLPRIYGPRALWKPSFHNRTTYNARGYTARWRIEDNQLFLDDAGGTVGPDQFDPAFLEEPRTFDKVNLGNPPTSEKFADKKPVACDLTDFYSHPGPILADWVSQELLMPLEGQPFMFTRGRYLKVLVERGLVAEDPLFLKISPPTSFFGRDDVKIFAKITAVRPV